MAMLFMLTQANIQNELAVLYLLNIIFDIRMKYVYVCRVYSYTLHIY